MSFCASNHSGRLYKWLIVIIAIMLCGALTQAQDLPRVKGLEATEVTHDSITVTWKARPNAYIYILFLKGHGSDFGTEKTSYTFTGLEPKTKYTIRVRHARQDPDSGLFSWSRWSKKISVKTKSKPAPAPTPAPPPVADISIRAALADYCHDTNEPKWYAFDFDPVPNAVEYHIYLYPQHVGRGAKQVTATPDWFDCMRFMPAPGSPLIVDVEAFNAAGEIIAAGKTSVNNPY